MRDHSSDGFPEHSRGSSEMLHTSSWIVTHLLVEEFLELNSVSEERSRNIDAFSSDNNNFLTAQEFLGDVGSQTAEHVGLSVDHNNLVKHRFVLFALLSFLSFLNFIYFSTHRYLPTEWDSKHWILKVRPKSVDNVK